MSLFYVLVLGLAVSIDSFVAGLAYGFKNIRMPFKSLIVVGIITSACAGIAMLAAYFLGSLINTHLAMLSGAILLSFLGLWSILQEYLTKDVPSYEANEDTTTRQLTFSIGRIVISIMAKPETADIDHSKSISSYEALFLGLALGIDNMVATFAASLIGYLPIYTPIIMGIIQMLCIGGGLYLSIKIVSDKIKQRFPYVSGIVLVVLGLLRLG